MANRPPLEINLLFKWAKYYQEQIQELRTLHDIPNSVKSGVPNIFWAYSNGNYNGLYIYMFTKSIDTRYSQNNWIEWLTNQGYKVMITRDHHEAKQTILDYYNGVWAKD